MLEQQLLTSLAKNRCSSFFDRHNHQTCGSGALICLAYCKGRKSSSFGSSLTCLGYLALASGSWRLEAFLLAFAVGTFSFAGQTSFSSCLLGLLCSRFLDRIKG